jgi:hypothetical protein
LHEDDSLAVITDFFNAIDHRDRIERDFTTIHDAFIAFADKVIRSLVAAINRAASVDSAHPNAAELRLEAAIMRDVIRKRFVLSGQARSHYADLNTSPFDHIDSRVPGRGSDEFRVLEQLAGVGGLPADDAAPPFRAAGAPAPSAPSPPDSPRHHMHHLIERGDGGCGAAYAPDSSSSGSSSSYDPEDYSDGQEGGGGGSCTLDADPAPPPQDSYAGTLDQGAGSAPFGSPAGGRPALVQLARTPASPARGGAGYYPPPTGSAGGSPATAGIWGVLLPSARVSPGGAGGGGGGAMDLIDLTNSPGPAAGALRWLLSSLSPRSPVGH